MNLATTQIMYAASSSQFNHVGAGLVPAQIIPTREARMNLATTLSTQFQISKPKSQTNPNVEIQDSRGYKHGHFMF
jgi:hypothetical protein